MRGTTRTSRIAAYVASGALALSGLTLVSVPAEAAPDPVPAANATSWLAGELVDGLLPGQFGGSDIGLSIDAAFAFQTTGTQAGAVSDIADAIQSGGTGYLEYEYPYDSDGDGTNEIYVGQAANATAKAMALMQSLSPARTTVGGINLQSRLEDLTANAAPIAGRIVDVSTKDGTPDGQDYANTLGQAFAARALADAGSSEAAAARDFLLKQQCASGAFRFGPSASKTAVDQPCQVGDTPDTDATAIAVTQLRELPSTPAVTEAISDAEAWLRSQQRCDGAFGGGTSTEGSNANSTGLAAGALGAGPAARQAAAWLQARQIPQAEPAPLVDYRGAIALDSPALAAARASGITNAATKDQFRRSTAQSASGLALLDDAATPALTLTGPTGYVKQGTSQVLSTTGADAGTVLCVTGSGASTRGIAGASGWNSRVTVPAGTGTRAYTVRDAYGHSDTAAVKVLGPKTLPIYKTKSRVKRSGWVTARIGGLASGESAKIYYKGNLVRTGKATTAGVFSASFRVGRSLGLKRITGLGQFGDIRRGSTTVRVVR